MWLNLAEEDYTDMIVMQKSRRYRGAVLFSQQAVEKIIKAYIVEHIAIYPRKTHFIEELLKDAKLDFKETDVQIKDIKELSKSYTRVRYVDLSQQYYSNKRDTDQLLQTASLLYIWIKKKFKKN